MKTQREIYDELYKQQKQFLTFHNKHFNLSEDKISCKANMAAVKFTWLVFNEQNLLKEVKTPTFEKVYFKI